MSSSISPEVFKKINAFKNLSDAIHEVRKQIARDKAISPDDSPEKIVTESINTEKIDPKSGNLQYLGRKSTQGGRIVHMVGIKGSGAPYYEIIMDSHKMGKGPHVSAYKVSANGGLLDKNPGSFFNVEDAVKSVSNHHRTGSWS